MPLESQNSFQPANSTAQLKPPRKHARLILLTVMMILVGILATGYFWYRGKGTTSYPPMIYEKMSPCDQDGDGDCDGSDRNIAERTLGQCAGDNNFNALADADHDGCVLSQDIDLLYGYYDELAGWKTYRNEEYGFEFKYPASIFIEGKKFSTENIYELDLYNLSDNKAVINITIASDTSLTLNSWLEKEVGWTAEVIKKSDAKVEQTTVGEISAIRIENKVLDMEQLAIAFKKGNEVYYFDANYKENILTLKRIISTFKFISFTTTQQTSINNMATPPLFSNDQIKWQEILFDPNKSSDFMLRYDNYNYQSDPSKKILKWLQPPGHLWIAKVDDSDGANLEQIRNNFNNYYNSVLDQAGWKISQDIPERQISIAGPASDGALNSIWGYVKLQGNSAILIGLSDRKYVADWVDYDPGNSAPSPVCPCSLELKVFVSDEIGMSKLEL